MRLPGQASAATASCGEGGRIPISQPSLNAIVASFKKLTALVPVSNDMMRYADPAVDAFVRDDLVKVMALTGDVNFILGDGTQDTPMGYLGFANRYALATGGTPANYSSSANPTQGSGGNFVSANETFSVSTVGPELAGAVNRLDTANVPDMRRVWYMHPRSYNYLFNLQNSLSLYVYRDEMTTGKLLTYPIKRTTQIPINLWGAAGPGTNHDCSFIFLVEMTEDMILDSMQLELAVSREGTYIDAGGNTRPAFQHDETLIRAIAEHDHQMRHDAAIAVIQNVRWSPS